MNLKNISQLFQTVAGYAGLAKIVCFNLGWHRFGLALWSLWYITKTGGCRLMPHAASRNCTKLGIHCINHASTKASLINTLPWSDMMCFGEPYLSMASSMALITQPALGPSSGTAAMILREK
jgi:hypothetical protein